MNPSASLPTGDPAVDALVDLGAQAKQLPVGGHKALYTQVLEGLERELDADPAAALPAAELRGAASGMGQDHDQA